MDPAWFSQYDPTHKYRGTPPACWRGKHIDGKGWTPDFPSRLLDYKYPAVPNLGDMTTISDRILAGQVEAPDVLVGGTPCQAFSVAGLRGGLNDSRGQLTLHYVQLLNTIDDVRNKSGRTTNCIALWENVTGVLSDKTNAFGCFLGGLIGSEEPLISGDGKWPRAGVVAGPKRTAVWRVLNAQYFGVAQRRNRVFVVAGAGVSSERLAEVLLEWSSLPGGITEVGGKGDEVSGGLTHRPTADGGTGGHAVTQRVFENHPVDSRVTEVVGGVGPTVTARWGTGGGNIPLVQTEVGVGVFADGGQLASTLSLTFRQQSMPDKGKFEAVVQQGGVPYIVRRLTPVESERLQGFPDGYTDIPLEVVAKMPTAGSNQMYRYREVGGVLYKYSTDADRYHALGNSMAVPVMQWIGERLVKLLKTSTNY